MDRQFDRQIDRQTDRSKIVRKTDSLSQIDRLTGIYIDMEIYTQTERLIVRQIDRKKTDFILDRRQIGRYKDRWIYIMYVCIHESNSLFDINCFV